MKKLSLAIAASLMFAGSAIAVDLSHDMSYGSTVVTGNVKTHSTTHSDAQTFKFATDADAGRDLGSNDIRIVAPTGPVGHLNDTLVRTTVETGVDNHVVGSSIETSFTHSTTNANDKGSFSSVTAFHENTITVGSLTAGEGGRYTTYSQDMEGSSHTNGYTDTVKVDVNTSTNGGTENGSEIKYDTTHTTFGSSVTDKVSTTRKNTITDYSFIK